MRALEELKAIIEYLQKALGKAQNIVLQFDDAVSELNNLLAVMKGNAQLAARDQTDETKNELVRVVLANTARANQIIDQLRAKVAAEPQPPAAKSGTAPTPATILIVDDDKAMCSVVTRILAQGGHAITQASNGRDAIELCRKQQFDIVFLDIRLSDVSGIDVCRTIQTLPNKPCVVFFSGDPSIEDPTQLMRQEGAVGFIRKPFDIHEIENVVRLILSPDVRS
jgi:CheY-like chemotaxis protein